MKRIILAILALILSFALCACSGGGNSSSETQNSTPSSTSNSTSNYTPNSTTNSTSSNTPSNTTVNAPATLASAENTETTNADSQQIDDDDLPYWNGFDFGPNLEYGEEYEIQGDPGEYMNALEAAKHTFNIARDNGNIPEYSDNTEYVMTLVALESIDGEECYVYRLDIDEATGTLGAAYAFAYQSGNIYMQGYGGQYVLIAGDGSGDLFDDDNNDNWSDPSDTDVPNWWGEYKTDAFSIGITNYNGTGFRFTFFNLRNGQEFYDGAAAVDPDNVLRAEYGDIEYWLSSDFNSIDIFVPEGSEWSHLSGTYERID